jgi:hypothetical protein
MKIPRVWLGVTTLLLAGCGVLPPAVPLPFKSPQTLTGFVPYTKDSRVWLEPGAQTYAARVALVLPHAIARVEAAHGLPFLHAPRVHVCDTEACFKRYVRTPRLSAAVVPDNLLILSPNLNDRESWRLEGLLVHELAHLHLGQRIGHYHSTVPVWFHEGWATLTAGGAGAEFATDAQALRAAQSGRRIDLNVRDTPDTRHRAAAFGLSVHDFYRQSYLLVQALQKRDPEKFRQLTLAIQDNQDFGLAFSDVYGRSPQAELASVLDTLRIGDNGAAATSAILP